MNLYNTAILVEEDYKGEFSRFALTPHDFDQRYPDAPIPDESGDGYTLRPLVHIWYQKTTIGSLRWNDFFTDMYWELSETDVACGNSAYIEMTKTSHSLLNDILRTVQTNHLRDNLLVTLGCRAGVMDMQGLIELPSGSYGEDELADFAVETVARYYPDRDFASFDEHIENALLARYGKED